jgi:hypothetical protein
MAFERSLVGNSSALLVEEAPYSPGRRGRAKKQYGYIPADCISALRDRLADLE